MLSCIRRLFFSLIYEMRVAMALPLLDPLLQHAVMVLLFTGVDPRVRWKM